MPKGKYIEDLLKAFKLNDYKSFKETAEKIIVGEKDMSHYKLANLLEDIVNSFSSNNIITNNNSQAFNDDYFHSFPRDERDGSDLVSIIKPKYYLEDVILS